MGDYKLQKDLVFFVPGRSGSVFTRKAGMVMTEKILQEILAHLSHIMGERVDWVEDRRRKTRR